jgi:hypothetical protein
MLRLDTEERLSTRPAERPAASEEQPADDLNALVRWAPLVVPLMSGAVWAVGLLIWTMVL